MKIYYINFHDNDIAYLANASFYTIKNNVAVTELFCKFNVFF